MAPSGDADEDTLPTDLPVDTTIDFDTSPTDPPVATEPPTLPTDFPVPTTTNLRPSGADERVDCVGVSSCRSSLSAIAASTVRPRRQFGRPLAEAGFGAVFLDFDEEAGLKIGRRKARRAARELRVADAIIFLGSSTSERSIWCAAEITVAKALEKDVLPIQLEAKAHHQLLGEEQWVAFRGDLNDSVRRLLKALEDRSPANAHRRYWDDRRSPFPGLSSFELPDAGVPRTRFVRW